MPIRVLLVLLCLAAALPAGAQFVHDSFTASSNQFLEAHTPDTGGAWTRASGGSGVVVRASDDTIVNAGNNDPNVYTNATAAPTAEYVVGMAVTFGNPSSNNYIEVYGRVSGGNAYFARLNSQGGVILGVYVAGVPTVLSSTSVSLSAGSHLLILSITNASKEVYVDGTLRASSTNNTVTAAGIAGLAISQVSASATTADEFFAGTIGPTAIDSLEATALREDNRVLLSWETTGEVDNAGFRIHRESRGKRELLTPNLIAGSAFLAGRAALKAGNSYQWMDERAPLAARYWIEELDLHGKQTWHGPFVPKRGSFDARRAVSRSITELTSGGQTILSVLAPLSIASTVSPAAQTDLAGARATKLYVPAPGWYRVPLDATLDAKKLALFTEGNEVATRVENGALYFYGQPLDTQWTAQRVYWLAERNGKPKRIESVTSSDTKLEQTSYRATIERHDKVFFFPAVVNDDGDGFLGPVVSMDPATPTIQTLTLSGVAAAQDAQLTVTLQGGTDLLDKQHRVSVSVNGTAVGECTFTGQGRPTCSFTVPAALLRDGANDVGYAAQNGYDDISAVVALRLEYSRAYRAENDRLQFALESGRLARLSGFTSSDLLVLDITDPANVFEVPLRAGLTVALDKSTSGGGTRVLYALPRTASDTVARVEANEPSSLLSTKEADVIILTHPGFASAVEPLRQLRVSQGLSVLVATTTDVYDELNSGHKDPAAIRAFLSAARKWKTPPRYVVLVGDATFDPRNYLGAGDADFVPTRLVRTEWLRTASDAWYTDFDGDLVSEIAIGRLPARTRDEAAAMVRKIVAYETAPPDATWSRRALFVADAGFEDNTRTLATAVPSSITAQHIDVAVSGGTAARTELLADLDQGALVTAFAGHGSIELWTAQHILTRNDALQLRNGARLPLVAAMTCLNAYFHDLYTDSLAEALMRSENGGAIAVWASSALSEPTPQLTAGRAFLASALTAPRIGDAFLAAQRSATMAEVRSAFVLIGDPATRLRR